MNYEIFTDGSHLDKQNNGRLGIGGVILKEGDSKILDEFSEELTKDYMLMEYGTVTASNPTAELIAVLRALQKFRPLIKSPNATVRVYADFRGVSEWMNGNWKTKEPYIKKIKDLILEEIQRQGYNIEFRWVKGHQSVMSREAKWNNYVDKLAKGQI